MRFDVRILGGLLALSMAVGCDNNGGDGNGNTVDANATPAATDTVVTDDNFSDGLHPNAAASSDIASVFAGRLSATPDASRDANTIVCLGDSITAAGYPSDLSSMTGKNAVNEGMTGELSEGGARRVSSVLSTYNTGYLCILYGFNDLYANRRSPADVIQSLSQIVAAARAVGVVPVLATLTPVSGNYAVYQSAIDDLNDQIRGLASSQGVALADLASIF